MAPLTRAQMKQLAEDALRAVQEWVTTIPRVAALRASLARLMLRAAQGSVVAQYMVYLNLRAQERWYDRSRPFY